MSRSAPIRIIVLFLGLWVALAPAVVATAAAAMTAHASSSDRSGSGACAGCPGDASDKGICMLVCFNAALFATTAAPAQLYAEFSVGYEATCHRTLLGRLPIPDLTPPKTVSLS